MMPMTELKEQRTVVVRPPSANDIPINVVYGESPSTHVYKIFGKEDPEIALLRMTEESRKKYGEPFC